ncbi:MAG: tyrosine-type recombinase/integrase, partial [Novosphingobium sp.]
GLLSVLSKLQRRGHDEAIRDIWGWGRGNGWKIVKAAMADAGIVGPQACPKGLRHGFAVTALQQGLPLNMIRKWLGHSRLSTTAIYADATGPEERDIAERFWRTFT